MSNRRTARFPTLFVGIGGTGVKTLRYLAGIAATGHDPDLAAMLADGALQLIGIDTDAGSNAPDTYVDTRMVPDPENQDEYKPLNFSRLPPLKNFVRIEADDISKALLAIRNSVRKVQAAEEQGKRPPDEHELKHHHIAQWFPRPTASGDEISYGQSKQAGAAQWRALGRTALFLQAPDIYNNLQTGYAHIKAALENDHELAGLPRAYIVGSIAGGTGSGMFWDIAFMLRSLSPNLLIKGTFLLPDVFVPLDRANRIMPNAYAALKELAYLKNWVWKERFTFEWPGCPQTFTAYQGGMTAFDSVYLYRGFNPSRKAESFNKARVDLSCYRIAENMLAQIRVDVFTEIDQGANNESGDATAQINDPEARYVFASSGAVEFRLDSLRRIQALTWKHCQRLMHQHVHPALRDILPEPDLHQLFDGDLTATGNGRAVLTATLAKALPATPEFAKNWAADIRQAWKEQKPGLDAACKSAATKDDHLALNFSELRQAYETVVPREIRDAWQTALDGHIDLATIKPIYELSLGKAYEKDFRDQIDTITKRVDAMHQRLKHEGLVLTREQRNALESLRDWLGPLAQDELASDPSVAPDPTPAVAMSRRRPETPTDGWHIVAPMSFVHLTCSLALRETATNVGQFTRWYHKIPTPTRTPYHPLGLRQLATERLDNLIDGLCEQLEVPRAVDERGRAAALETYLPDSPHGIKLAQALSALLLTENKIRNRRKQFCRDIESQLKWERHDQETLDTEREVIARSLNPVLDSLVADASTPGLLARYADYAAQRWQRQVRKFDTPVISELKRNVVGPEDAPAASAVDAKAAKAASTAEQQTRYETVPYYERPNTWRHMLEALAKTSSTTKPERRIFDAVDSVFQLDSAHVANLDDESLEHRKAAMQRLIISLIDQLLSAESGVIARLGGADVLPRQLAYCDSKVFKAGAISNSISKTNLILVKKDNEHLIDEMQIEDEGDQVLDQLFHNAAQRRFASDPRVASLRSDFPLIYYETLSRSAEEIDDITRYRESYQALGSERRGLFHLFPGIAELPDVVTSDIPPHPVYCGNPGCGYDLRYDPRSTLICPDCHGPIWNRCGNEDCAEDEVMRRIKEANDGKMPHPHPHQCPTCENDLLTYWWTCKQHSDTPVPADKEQCPRCLAEYQRDERTYDTISYRPDLEAKECPGCLSLGTPPKKRTRIPPSMIRYYQVGVNGHDSTQFPELAKQFKLKPHRCTNATREHFLFPTCPASDPSDPHHLYRNADNRFVCPEPEHRGMRFYECGHCGYPIDKGAFSESDHATTCPRCLRTLEVCQYCSDAQNKVYQPQKETHQNHAHCPNCSNVMEPMDNSRALILNVEFERPGYCRNIVDCDAARDLWCTVSDYHHETCKVCNDPGATLLNRKALYKHMQRCPVCLSLFGIPEQRDDNSNNPPVQIPREKIPDYISEHTNCAEFRASEPCPHCGTRPAEMLYFCTDMHLAKPRVNDDEGNVYEGKFKVIDDDASSALPKDSSGKPLFSVTDDVDLQHLPDDLNYDDLINILKIMIDKDTDNATALDKLTRLPFFPRYRGRLDELNRMIMNAFDRSVVSARSLEKRLKEISRLHNEELAREGGAFNKTSC